MALALCAALTPSTAGVAAAEPTPSWSAQLDAATGRGLPVPRTDTIDTDGPSPGDMLRWFWSNKWAFARCVALVGIPFGIALAIAIDPAVSAWVLGAGLLPALIASRFGTYAEWIKSTCGGLLRA
jgi:hypothetical protein